MMITIGITGGVGAGKSTVLDFLEEKYQAYVMKADEIGHLVMEPVQSCYEPVIALFGRQIIKNDKTIDRRQVSDVVFSHPELLEKLNQIIHPAVKQYIREQLAVKKQQGQKICVVEAALLLEDHYQEFCDTIWYIHTDEEIECSNILEKLLENPYQETDGEPRLYKREISQYHCQSGTGDFFSGKCRLCCGK